MDADAGHLTQVHGEPLYLTFAVLPDYHGAGLNFGGIIPIPPSLFFPQKVDLQTQTRRCNDQDPSQQSRFASYDPNDLDVLPMRWGDSRCGSCNSNTRQDDETSMKNMTRWTQEIYRSLLLLVLMLVNLSCDDFGVNSAIGWTFYRDALLLYSNAEGVQVLNLKTGQRTVVAKNGEIIDYYPTAAGNPRSDAAKARWSPDGQRIVYVEGDGGTDYSQITVMNSDGRNKRVIVSEGIPFAPNWSPDAFEIIYQKSPAKFGANYEIFVIGADGTNERQLTNRPGFDGQPAFSRDSDEIIYAAEPLSPTYTIQLFMVKKDGTGVEQLTQPTRSLRQASGPSWSRHSDEIVFSGKDSTEPDCEIYLLKEQDRKIGQLTNHIASANQWVDNLSASWSNDGKLIVYSQHHRRVSPGPSPLPSVWVMKPDGSTQTQILDNAQDPDLFLRSQ